MTNNLRPLPTCEWEHCSGHLGKFDSCRDEALYEMTLDGFDESTGDSDFDGHFVRVVLDEDTAHRFEEDGPTIIVPAGHYLVESANSGAVSVWVGTETEIQQHFDHFAARYEEWSDEERDEDSDGVFVCPVHGYESL